MITSARTSFGPKKKAPSEPGPAAPPWTSASAAIAAAPASAASVLRRLMRELWTGKVSLRLDACKENVKPPLRRHRRRRGLVLADVHRRRRLDLRERRVRRGADPHDDPVADLQLRGRDHRRHP